VDKSPLNKKPRTKPSWSKLAGVRRKKLKRCVLLFIGTPAQSLELWEVTSVGDRGVKGAMGLIQMYCMLCVATALEAGTAPGATRRKAR